MQVLGLSGFRVLGCRFRVLDLNETVNSKPPTPSAQGPQKVWGEGRGDEGSLT